MLKLNSNENRNTIHAQITPSFRQCEIIDYALTDYNKLYFVWWPLISSIYMAHFSINSSTEVSSKVITCRHSNIHNYSWELDVITKLGSMFSSRESCGSRYAHSLIHSDLIFNSYFPSASLTNTSNVIMILESSWVEWTCHSITDGKATERFLPSGGSGGSAPS